MQMCTLSLVFPRLHFHAPILFALLVLSLSTRPYKSTGHRWRIVLPDLRLSALLSDEGPSICPTYL